MTLAELKIALAQVNELTVFLPNRSQVPVHFHVTEIGLLSKKFIDCGGAFHEDQYANIQFWVAQDYDHRLKPSSFISIIKQSEALIANQDIEIEIEYQQDTICKYGLSFDGRVFHLLAKETDCLAKDNCGIPTEKKKLSMAELGAETSCCAPGSGCC